MTELAVIEPTEDGLVLREVAPGVTKDQVIKATQASLIVGGHVPEMAISESLSARPLRPLQRDPSLRSG